MDSEMTMMGLEDFFLQHQQELQQSKNGTSSSSPPIPVFVVCRRGNDSQRAVKLLQDKFSGLSLSFKDIQGGLHGWAKHVDTNFPIYWSSYLHIHWYSFYFCIPFLLYSYFGSFVKYLN